jgi:hypothetical protein
VGASVHALNAPLFYYVKLRDLQDQRLVDRPINYRGGAGDRDWNAMQCRGEFNSPGKKMPSPLRTTGETGREPAFGVS